jgi:hypothetical protein
MRIEKTVFISYRRTNFPWALLVYHDLVSYGYDAFFDFTGLASGDFERAIMQNIRARAHFVVLLTPSALNACDRPEDWLRREIEAALEARRNIIPLMLEGFDFSSPDIATKLTGKLTALQRYGALEIPMRYFDDAMRRLREWLNKPLEAVLHPVSPDVQHATQHQQQAASLASPVQTSDLTAQVNFERALTAESVESDFTLAKQHASEPLFRFSAPLISPAEVESFNLEVQWLTSQLASAPLFSAAEEAMLKSLPLVQQTIMRLEAKKQREKLIADAIVKRIEKQWRDRGRGGQHG